MVLRFFFFIATAWLSVLCSFSGSPFPQDYFDDDYNRFRNYTYQPGIKTVKVYRNDDPLSDPIIELGSNEYISVLFDDLTDRSKEYQYRLIHCNSDWTPSSLSPAEYLEGFTDNPIREWYFSFNTYVKFINYRLRLPNEDVKMLLSGNYLLYVYEGTEQEDPILTHRFMLYENKCTVTGSARRATNLDYIRSHHEVDFTVATFFPVNDPYRNIKVVVRQNGRWDQIVTGVTPKFIRGNELIYDYEEEILFPGATEFRYFNSKDIRFKSENIAEIRYEEPVYHFYLENDDVRRFKVYKAATDINGKFKTDVSGSKDPDIEADYVKVTFTLPLEAPLTDGDLFVFGGLTGWEYNPEFKMQYNYDIKSYALTLLLKQGYYNYHYSLLRDNTQSGDIGYIEGNHYETENDYHILIYYRDIARRYDQLIGYSMVNNGSQI
jgi:hypothetical protein